MTFFLFPSFDGTNTETELVKLWRKQQQSSNSVLDRDIFLILVRQSKYCYFNIKTECWRIDEWILNKKKFNFCPDGSLFIRAKIETEFWFCFQDLSFNNGLLFSITLICEYWIGCATFNCYIAKLDRLTQEFMTEPTSR